MVVNVKLSARARGTPSPSSKGTTRRKKQIGSLTRANVLRRGCIVKSPPRSQDIFMLDEDAATAPTAIFRNPANLIRAFRTASAEKTTICCHPRDRFRRSSRPHGGFHRFCDESSRRGLFLRNHRGRTYRLHAVY